MLSKKTRKIIRLVIWAVPVVLAILGQFDEKYLITSAATAIGALTSITFGSGVYFYTDK